MPRDKGLASGARERACAELLNRVIALAQSCVNRDNNPDKANLTH
jgi:hypothetical protein